MRPRQETLVKIIGGTVIIIYLDLSIGSLLDSFVPRSYSTKPEAIMQNYVRIVTSCLFKKEWLEHVYVRSASWNKFDALKMSSKGPLKAIQTNLKLRTFNFKCWKYASSWNQLDLVINLTNGLLPPVSNLLSTSFVGVSRQPLIVCWSLDLALRFQLDPPLSWPYKQPGSFLNGKHSSSTLSMRVEEIIA